MGVRQVVMNQNRSNPEDVLLYCEIMDRIKKHLLLTEDLLNRNQSIHNQYYRNDLLALYFRKILELIGFSSLVFHKQEYSELISDFNQSWSARKILIKIKDKINDDFYPTPCYRDLSKSGPHSHHLEICKTEYLTWELWKINIDELSEIIHETNPFSKSKVDYKKDNYYSYLKRLIENLLQTHFIKIIGKRVWICMLRSKDEPAICYPADALEKEGKGPNQGIQSELETATI
jgi:hypothetical protein